MAISVDLVSSKMAATSLCVGVCVPMLMLIFYCICIKFAKLLLLLWLLLLHKSYLFRKLLFHVRLSGSRSGSVACKCGQKVQPLEIQAKSNNNGSSSNKNCI